MFGTAAGSLLAGATALTRSSKIELQAQMLSEPAPVKVEFYVGDVLVGEAVGASPYQAVTEGLAPGVYSVVAVGTYADGHQESSRPATIAILPDAACAMGSGGQGGRP